MVDSVLKNIKQNQSNSKYYLHNKANYKTLKLYLNKNKPKQRTKRNLETKRKNYV